MSLDFILRKYGMFIDICICMLFFLLPLDGELSKEAVAIETLAVEAIKQVTPGPAKENLHALTKLLPKRRGMYTTNTICLTL